MTKRILTISAKCSDMCWVRADHLNLEKSGYAPDIPGLTDGDDYVCFDVDLDTGMIQNFRSITDRQLKSAIGDM